MSRHWLCWLVVLVLMGQASGEMVGYWSLDDGTGTVAADGTGNGHDGTLINDPQWVQGLYGGALLFDGAGAKVDISHSAQLNPTEEFSAVLWANIAEGSSGYRSPITSRDDYPQRGYIIYAHTDGMWSFWTGTGAGWNLLSGPDLVEGEWTHVGITFSNGDKKLYVNGELMAEGSADFSPNTAQVLRIGGGATEGDGNYFFDGIVDDVAVFDHTLTAGEIAAAMAGIAAKELAANPSPTDAESDVLRDVVLAWDAGIFAATHDVYLGTDFDDVNTATQDNPLDVLASQAQSDTTYDAGRLEFGQTYYWRIDEVNGPADYTVFKGDVWSFTVEPLAYPIADVTASTNGNSDAGAGPENTVNGSGLNASDQHSVDSEEMWSARAADDDPLWIQFEFDVVYKLHQMLVWNYNVEFETFLGIGLKDVTVEYSEDGVDWAVLDDVELAQAPGSATYTPNTTIDFAGVAVRYVRLIVNSNYGAQTLNGLSEVRFTSIPVQARLPEPADGATAVAVDAALSWRAGREAASHEVYLSVDEAAVLDGTALADVATQSAYSPDTLDFATTYYWKVTEVNEAETIPAWQGAVWSMTTQEFATIDGFEVYDNEENRIYDTWRDGWFNETGSFVGYSEEPFAEQSIVNSGRQSMPLAYYNDVSPFYSEAYRTWSSPQDWTAGGAESLRLAFQGEADNSIESLYVAVEDSAGNVAVITNEDPNAVIATAWQTWTISFDELTAAGVNMAGVETIYIGVGDRANPASDGYGQVYIDDIQFGRPLATDADTAEE